MRRAARRLGGRSRRRCSRKRRYVWLSAECKTRERATKVPPETVAYCKHLRTTTCVSVRSSIAKSLLSVVEPLRGLATLNNSAGLTRRRATPSPVIWSRHFPTPLAGTMARTVNAQPRRLRTVEIPGSAAWARQPPSGLSLVTVTVSVKLVSLTFCLFSILAREELNQQKQTRKIESHNRARNRTENSLSQHRQASKKNFTTKQCAMETAEYMLQEVMGLETTVVAFARGILLGDAGASRLLVRSGDTHMAY